MTRYIYIILAVAAMAVSCSVKDDILPSGQSQMISITAELADENDWDVATRAQGSSYSEVKLYYTNYKGEHSIYNVPDEDWFVTGINGKACIVISPNSNFVWQMIQRPESGNPEIFISYIDNKDGVMAFGSHTPEYETGDFTFTNLSYTKAKLTVNFTLLNNLETSPLPEQIKANVKARVAGEYNAWNNRAVWPTYSGAVKTDISFEASDAGDYVYSTSYTGSILLPQQTMDSVIELVYDNGTTYSGDDVKWTLDLSSINVKGGMDGQKAHQLYAGQHLILNLKAGSTTAMESELEVDAYIRGEGNEVSGTAESGYTYNESTKTYTISNLYGFYIWLDAWVEEYDEKEFDSPVKLAANFPTEAADIIIPESYLWKYDYSLITINNSDQLKLGGHVWKSITLVDQDGNTVGVLGNSGEVMKYTEIKTLTIDGIVHAVVSGSVRNDPTNIANAALDLEEIFKKNNISSFYVTGQLIEFDASNNNDSEINGHYLSARSTFGAAFELMYAMNYDNPTYNVEPAYNIRFPEATSLPNRALFYTQAHHLYFPKVTSLGNNSLAIKSPTNLPEDGLLSLYFGEVIYADYYYYADTNNHPFAHLNTSNVDLTLNAAQEELPGNSILKPAGNIWGQVTWKSISLQ